MMDDSFFMERIYSNFKKQAISYVVDPDCFSAYTSPMFQFIEFPVWISPYLIPGMPIRWYSVMYIVAFTITFLLFLRQVRQGALEITLDDTFSLFLYTIAGLILGARLFSVLIYDGSWYYWTHPWLIFWPFQGGRFIGLPGMSYHGGLIGAAAGCLLFCRQTKRSFLKVTDIMVAGIPLGYTFGRLGNFINGELWGKVTASPIGILFPDAPRFSTNYAWVRQIADSIGLPYALGTYINLPRHPSQLYEALFEGVVLWLFLWFVIRKKKTYPGFLLGWYLIGYGLVRFCIEYLREPDANIGFIIAAGKSSEPYALFQSFFNISLGQILCGLMITAGVVLLIVLRKRNSKVAPLGAAIGNRTMDKEKRNGRNR